MTEYNETGRTFSPKEMSVADYLDYWLENAIKKNIGHGYSYNTYLDYESKIRIHLKPTFGIYRLGAFQFAPDVVQSWVDNMKIQGLSKSMVKNTLACLQGALNYAILPLNYIKANPCIPVQVGKIPVNMAAKEKAEYICPKEEFDRILRRFPLGNNFYLPLIIPYNVGTRIGETYAIDLLEDVDFKSHKLKINDQMMKIEKTWYLQPPKYESYRNVKMGKHLELEFKEAIKQRKINQLKYGSQYLKTYELPDKSIVQVRSDIVIPHKEIMLLGAKENGELLTPESFQYCARVVHKELGNPLFHSHCLRHTHGTILAERGINPRSVMERLGHKDIKTTLQTYTFNTDLMQQNAADVFEKYMYG